jgi:hypothetical protein
MLFLSWEMWFSKPIEVPRWNMWCSNLVTFSEPRDDVLLEEGFFWVLKETGTRDYNWLNVVNGLIDLG